MSVYVASYRLVGPPCHCPSCTAPPPTRKSSASSVAVKFSSAPNHWACCSGIAKASQTRSRGASNVRSTTKVACVTLRVMVVSFDMVVPSVWSVVLRGSGEEIAEPVQPAFRGDPLAAHPLPGAAQGVGDQLDRADAADLVRGDDPGVLEHGEVLVDGGQGHRERGGELADGD